MADPVNFYSVLQLICICSQYYRNGLTGTLWFFIFSFRKDEKVKLLETLKYGDVLLAIGNEADKKRNFPQ